MRLTHVLINLIKNSIKFTDRGYVNVYHAYDKDSSTLKVGVIDSGRGIHSDKIKKLFHLFEKLKRAPDIDIEGIGKGLAICQRLVEMNNGYIEIFSEGIS